MIRSIPPKIEMVEVTDETEISEAQQRRQQFKRNSDWLQANISDVYSNNRGRYICISGQQLFVADSVTEAIAEATATHPEDKGWFTRYIPREKVPRIYAV